ncbi:MAG: cysteine desulfurase [Cyanobacteria bacterium]|nr:cysteine desulfurase [Cyanobacteriota bacterium]
MRTGLAPQFTSAPKFSNIVYLDYAASTPVDPTVADTMCYLLGQTAGNPHAAHHPYGSSAAKHLEVARQHVANSINASAQEIIFTSGATESNNLIIRGIAQYLRSVGKTHILTNEVEHKSVLGPLESLKKEGFEITVLPVKPCGMVEANMIERALRENTGLVSVQAVNNELGTVQPLSEISSVLRPRGVLFHSDAAQALGKIGLSVHECGVDFLSLSAHKVYGPQGVGAVFARSDAMHLLEATVLGGMQERGLRAGTVPVFLCAGFGTACSLLVDDRERLQSLRRLFLERVGHLCPLVYGHSDEAWNVPGILNIRFPGIDSETLVMELPKLAFGLGSACSSTGNQGSRVIKAITASDGAAKEAIRLSFGRFTTRSEIESASDQIIEAVQSIKQLQGVA